MDQVVVGATRRVVGTVGVDSGRMAFATESAYGAVRDAVVAGAGPGWVVSGTGWGDGCYDVLEVLDAAGAVCGVEVLFDTDDVHDEVCARAGLTAPDAGVWRAVGGGDRDAVAALAAFDVAFDGAAGRYWDDAVARSVPAGDPRQVAVLDVDGVVGVGDPCYGAPSLSVVLTPGRYAALVWDGPGGREARLGLHRLR